MTRRVVLSPRVARLDFEDMAFRLGWKLHQVVDPSEDRPYEEIWSVDDGRSAVHYIEDELLGLLYAVVLGEDIERLEAEIRHALETVRPSDVLSWLEDAVSAPRRVQAAAYLAASVDQLEPNLVVTFGQLLRDPVPDVRRAAIFGATYAEWPELIPLIEEIASHDPDGAVRRAAEDVAQVMRRHSAGPGQTGNGGET